MCKINCKGVQWVAKGPRRQEKGNPRDYADASQCQSNVRLGLTAILSKHFLLCTLQVALTILKTIQWWEEEFQVSAVKIVTDNLVDLFYCSCPSGVRHCIGHQLCQLYVFCGHGEDLTAWSPSCYGHIYKLVLAPEQRLIWITRVYLHSERLVELHRGQGKDIYWRDLSVCPSEEEYKIMVRESELLKSGEWHTMGSVVLYMF